jgi:phosphonopyruvate decarboxylase
MQGKDFLSLAKKRGFKLFCGVPCSYMNSLFNAILLDEESRYLSACNEGEAVGIVAGAWLAGEKAMLVCQNSGLGNMVNPIASLTDPFQIPIFLVVSKRGEVRFKDEPQHRLMGQITETILQELNVHCEAIREEAIPLEEQIERYEEVMRARKSIALITSKMSFDQDERASLRAPNFQERSTPDIRYRNEDQSTRFQALEAVVETLREDTAVISTTGMCSRELFTISDRKEHFYMVGSMGCASAIGLGVALHTARNVVVLDGDGALLMKMGTLATIGLYRPKNLIHILLDNQAHDSTGGQFTNGANVDFPAIAAACSYRNVYACDHLSEFIECLSAAQLQEGPTFLYLRILMGSKKDVARPTLAPHEVAARFHQFLTVGALCPS